MNRLLSTLLRGMPTWLPLAVCALILAGAVRPPKPVESGLDLNRFAELPVLMNGRIKPLDTVARTSLLILQDKQTLLLPKAEGEDKAVKMPAIVWLAELMFQPELADKRPVFLIHDPDVLGLMGIEHGERTRYSFHELLPHLEEVERQAQQAGELKAEQRSRFQRDVVKLRAQVQLYAQLRNGIQPLGTTDMTADLSALAPMRQAGIAASQGITEQNAASITPEVREFLARVQPYVMQSQLAPFFPIAPMFPNAEKEAWQKLGDSVLTMDAALPPDRFAPGVMDYAQMAGGYRASNAQQFNSALENYRAFLEDTHPQVMKKTVAETFFNRFAPFYQCMVLYVLAGMLAVVSWLAWQAPLVRAGYVVLLVAVAVHTAGLAFRIMLEGRPPVTNLYSSAVFIGYAVSIFGIVLERLYRLGFGTVAAATTGFCTLLVAHHLSLSGDTMEMMQAVLDSNFWLATHVIIITLGYAGTFLAGTLAILYIILGLFTKGLNARTADSLNRMVYGIICFAALFSLVGTILGGIWADQSWGRFWGWDPKENGALLIVLWNAVILHARWGGLARARGIMQMAVFGNIVTSWSWFGTNMLNVGLHSYGFMSEAFYALWAFVISQLVFIVLAWIPLRHWRSFRKPPGPPVDGQGRPIEKTREEAAAEAELALP